VLEQILWNVFVDDQLSGIDDAHVEAGFDRMEQEGGMNRLADDVVAAERERKVAHAAADLHAGTRRLDGFGRLDEVDRVLVVFLEACRNRQDVRVEDDVEGIETGLVGQQRVGALADGDLALDRVRLPLLVERHDNHGSAVTADRTRLAQEVVLALLEADRIDDPFALYALQARLEDAPFRAVHHNRHTRDLRLGGNQVEERRHRGFGVEHPFVHVDVQDVGAAAHLIDGNVCGFREVAARHQTRETFRAGDIGPLANHDEVGVRADRQGLET
jgi:hypothetical protein